MTNKTTTKTDIAKTILGQIHGTDFWAQARRRAGA